MNVLKSSTLVTGDVPVVVGTVAEDSIININIVNTGMVALRVSVYITSETELGPNYLIDYNSPLDVGAVLLRCGEPIKQGESIYVEIEPTNPDVTEYMASVRVSGIYDLPLVLEP